MFTVCVAYNVAACGRSGARRSCVAAAAAVDRQARRSCRVWRGGMNQLYVTEIAGQNSVVR